MRSSKLWMVLSGLLIMAKLSFSCTTFAIPTSQNIYIGKNRDMFPDVQALEVIVPQNGIKYLAIVSKSNSFKSKWVIRAAINQDNLAIVNMSVDTHIKLKDKSFKSIYDDGDDFMTYILSQYKSVDSVIKDLPKLIKKYNYPEFYTLADGKTVAYIEVEGFGQYKVKASTNKLLVHTNHYLIDKDINGSAITESETSMMRFNRMSELLVQSNNYSLKQLESFMNDHSAGDNTSILRTGSPASNPSSARTLAHFIAEIPVNGAPASIYVQLITTSQKFKLTLDKKFWQSFSQDQILSIH